jgi:signal transduction histidine kinase
MSNAVKYASSGKRIVLDCEKREGCWNIRVMDFGEGIEDRDKKPIFDRFHRLEKKGVKGSGLGLAIASRIMELHNGRIWVEDNPEGGAVFVVEIPKHLY